MRQWRWLWRDTALTLRFMPTGDYYIFYKMKSDLRLSGQGLKSRRMWDFVGVRCYARHAIVMLRIAHGEAIAKRFAEVE